MDPMTRSEIFMAATAGEYDGDPPAPVTRSECYWQKIIARIEGGASVDPDDINAAIADYLNTHDADIVTEAELARALGDYTTTADLNTALSGKADSSDIPDVSAFITRLVNDLVNYYTKSETYTKAEIDSKVSAIPKFAIEVVNSLPVQDISPTTVYLLTSQTQENGNLYTEYLHVGNAWELLGSQTVDLSGYYTSAQVDALLSGLSVSGHTHDDRYYTETEIDNKLSEKSNTGHSHVPSDVTGLDSVLAGKADANHNHSGVYAPASHTHTKSQISNLSNASSSAAGLMSAEDKAKLDAITAAKMQAWDEAAAGLTATRLFSGMQNVSVNDSLTLSESISDYDLVEVYYGQRQLTGAYAVGVAKTYVSASSHASTFMHAPQTDGNSRFKIENTALTVYDKSAVIYAVIAYKIGE